MPSPTSQRDIYVGKVADQDYRLYTSVQANLPLPSHTITLIQNEVVQLDFYSRATTQYPATDFDDPFVEWNSSNQPLKPPETTLEQRIDSKHVRIEVNVTGATGEFSFSLKMADGGTARILQRDTLVDPTVVEKPGGEF